MNLINEKRNNMEKFTEAELKEITEIQSEYQSCGISLVQLQVMRNGLEKDLQAIKEKEDEVKNQIFIISEREQKLSKDLSEKYGIGTLDMETGTFTPQK